MADLSPLDFYLFVLKPPAVLTGLVASDPASPYMSIAYNAGVTGGVAGSAGVPLAGNTAWFGTSAGGRERGILRLRYWLPGDATGTAGTLSVAESDDVGPVIEAGDYITIKQDFRLWPIYPRIVQVSDTEFTYYEDYDIPWNGQTREWRPVAVAGPPAVVPLENSDWWNSAWLKRQQLVVTAGDAVTAGYSVRAYITGSYAAAIYNDCLASGNDLRVVYRAIGGTWTDLDRDLVTFSAAAIDVWFPLQAGIAGGGMASSYYLYYDNPAAGAPLADKANVYLFYDDFNRADSNTVGNGWVESFNGLARGTEDAPGDCQIKSNQLQLIEHAIVSQGGIGSGILASLQYTMPAIPGSGNNLEIWFSIRRPSSGTVREYDGVAVAVNNTNTLGGEKHYWITDDKYPYHNTLDSHTVSGMTTGTWSMEAIMEADYAIEGRFWQGTRPITPTVSCAAFTPVADGGDFGISTGSTLDHGPKQTTVDYLLIRKHVSDEPTVAMGGVQQPQAQVKFVGDRSFALAPGATLASFLWTAYGSVEGTSASQGTEASPVTFTYRSTGQKLVSLKVNDSNGKTHTAYTWVFVYDPADVEAVGYKDFDAANDSFDFERGGGECSFTVHGGATIADFPQEAMVVHACQGDITTPTASWPFRTNILFVGYITQGTIRQNPTRGDVSFQAATVDQLMRNLTMFPVRIDDKRGPNKWVQGKALTVDRVASFLYHYRSTLAMMTPIVALNYTAQIAGQDFGPRDMYSGLQDELVASAWARVVCDTQGVLHLVRDYQLMTAAERAAVTRRKTLHKGIWVGDVEISERADYVLPANQYKMSGIYYPGSEAAAVSYFSEAPGDAPKPFGAEQSMERLILTSQSDLNERCGLALAREAMRYPSVRMNFLNDGSFTVARQEIFPAAIEPGDNDRGLSWTPDLIPRRTSRNYDHAGGYFSVEVEFEPSASGPAGVTVVMPAEPPDTTMATWDQDFALPVPWTPPASPTPGAAVAADAALGVYWTDFKGQTWERRVNGLESSQWAFRDLIWDPWWMNKTGGHNPAQAILLGCGPGFVATSDDAGKNWKNLTPLLTDPPNTWADSPAPTVAALTFKQVHATIHGKDTFLVLAEWQNGSGAWRSWMLKTADFFKTSTWYPLVLSGDGQGIIFQSSQSGPPWTGVVVGDSISGMDASCIGGPTDDFLGLTNDWFRLHFTAPWAATRWRLVAQRKQWTTGGDNDIVPPLGGSLQTGGCPTSWGDYDSGVQNYLGALVPSTAYYFQVQKRGGGDAYWRKFTIYDPDSSATPTLDTRALAMDVDDEDGTRVYVTMSAGGALYLQNRAFADLSINQELSFGAATAAEVAAKTYYLYPHVASMPGTAGYGNRVYAFGRYNSGGVKHLAVSIDGGASATSIGNAAWTTERVGAIAVDAAGQTVHAFLNSGSPALWRTLNGGTDWAQINTLPFSLEMEAMSRHWGDAKEILIGNNTPAGPGDLIAAYQSNPYGGVWVDASGNLPKATDGSGGLVSVIWV